MHQEQEGGQAFRAVFAPWIEQARAAIERDSVLAGLLGHERRCFAAALEQHLFERLTKLAAPALFDAFDRQRPRDPLSLLLDTTPADVSTADYDRFCADLARSGHLAEWLRTQPPLQRRLCNARRQALRNTRQLARRFLLDQQRWRPLLRSRGARPLLVEVEFGLSDPHAYGQTVAKLVFADGSALVYKPRCLDNEQLFLSLLAWLQARTDLPTQHLPGIATSTEHGWMEWVAPSECQSKADVAAFFTRLGALMGLLRMLHGVDLHDENLIAAGAYPVLVDLECLFTPRRCSPAVAHAQAESPVFDSGLLPHMVVIAPGRVRQLGGGGPPSEVAHYETYGFLHGDTDWIRRAMVRVPALNPNLPVWQGERQDIGHYARECADGYQRMLLACVRHAPALWAPNGPLATWRPSLARYVTLPTQSYYRIADRLAEPQLANHTLASQQLLECLRRSAPPGIAPGPWARMLAAERQALWRGDIPAFRFDLGSGCMQEAGGDEVGVLWLDSPWQQVEADWRGLDESAAAFEAELVLNTLSKAQQAPLCWGHLAPEGDWRALASQTLLAIEAQLRAQVRHRADGSAHWLRLVESPPHAVHSAGLGLYHGNVGIAVFLARLHAAGRSAGAAELAMAALLPLRRLVRTGGTDELLQACGLGYAQGVGGMLAGLLACAELLDDAAILNDALTLAGQLELPTASMEHDIHSGAAGLLLALAQLYHRTGASELLPLLHNTAERLWRECSVLAPWPVDDSGLAHGRLGIAAALAAVPVIGDKATWRTAIDQLLVDEAEPTADRASGGGIASARQAWCRGSPGAALAYAALERFAGRTDCRPRLRESLLATVKAVGPGPGDLCCGNAGRLAIVLQLSRLQKDSSLEQLALEQLIVWMRSWAQQPPALWSDPFAPGMADICLFKGTAGVGYALLEALEPELGGAILLPGLDQPSAATGG